MRLFMLLALFLMSCATVDSQNQMSNDPSLLYNYNWSVTALSGNSLIENTQLTLIVTDDGKVNGSGGVNKYFGQLSFDKNQVKSSKMARTRMYRSEPKGIMEQENNFMELLSSTTHWRINNTELVFLSDSFISEEQVVIKFEKRAVAKTKK